MTEQTKSMLEETQAAVLDYAEAQDGVCTVIDGTTVMLSDQPADLLVIKAKFDLKNKGEAARYSDEVQAVNKLAEVGKVYTFEPGTKVSGDSVTTLPDFIVMDRDEDLSNPRVLGASIEPQDALSQARKTLELGYQLEAQSTHKL